MVEAIGSYLTGKQIDRLVVPIDSHLIDRQIDE